MSMIMQRNIGKTRLGELVVGAGLLQKETVENALLVARKAALPLGRVLMMSGGMNEREVFAALGIQQLMRDGVIGIDTAFQALQEVRYRKASLSQALNMTGFKRSNPVHVNQLGDFVVAAGVATQAAVSSIARKCSECGWELGRGLVVNGVITLRLLWSYLGLRAMVLDGSLTSEQALRILEIVHFYKTTLERACSEIGIDYQALTRPPRLVELLCQARLISETDAAFALEMAMEKKMQVGKTLVQLQLISERTFIAAIQVQHMVRQQSLWAEHAVQLLQYVHSFNTPLAEILAEMNKIARAIDLLQESGLDVETQVSDAANGRTIGQVDRVLVSSLHLDEFTLRRAQDYIELVEQGEMSFNTAAESLSRELLTHFHGDLAA